MAIEALCSYIVCSYIKKTCSPKETDFGRQRLFGSIGFGGASFIAGCAVDHFHDERLSEYTAAFYVILPFCLVFIPFMFHVAWTSEIDSSVESKNIEPSVVVKLKIEPENGDSVTTLDMFSDFHHSELSTDFVLGVQPQLTNAYIQSFSPGS